MILHTWALFDDLKKKYKPQMKETTVTGSTVVECLTRDREAAGSSFTGVTVVVLEQDTFILA